jgi:hypothetical protein
MGALLRQTAKSISQWSADNTLSNRLAEQMYFQNGNRPSQSEKRSWENSLRELSSLLVDSNLGNLNVLVEFQLPYTSKRIDAVLVGSHPKSRAPVIIAIELKQWTEVAEYQGETEVVKVAAYGNNPILHPSLQVKKYCEYLLDFNRFASNESTEVFGIAYLHNWTHPRNKIIDAIPPSETSMLFLGSERGVLKVSYGSHF